MSRTAFLTGGTGFVGANLARLLLDDGWRVRALARAGSDRRNFGTLPIEVVDGDVAEPEPSLAAKIGKADAVFHVAAHYSLFRRDAAALMRSNVIGTRTLLAAARRAGTGRVVYTSSVAAIGVRHGASADETFQSTPEALIGTYKRSKYLAEREALAAAAAGQDVVIVNPSTPIGPWDRKPTPTGEILVRFLRGNMPAAIPPTGLNVVDVADVARGHVLAFERGRPGERYILGSENLSLRALLQRVGAIVGRPAPKYDLPIWIPYAAAWLDEIVLTRLGKSPSIPIDGVRMSEESMFYDTSKAQRELGYVPSTIDDAVRNAVDWYGAHGYYTNGANQQAWQSRSSKPR